MLTLLGALSIIALLVLILGRITSVLVALIVVPIAAGLAGGFGAEIGTFAAAGIRSVAEIAALLAFAVIYFGVMKDAGLFEPVIRFVLAVVGQSPVKIALATAAVATVAHLDGAGASTFMVTVPALLPIYRRLRLDPLVLTTTTALAAGAMNLLPWAGPTTRAATAIDTTVGDLFLPIIPANVAGLVTVFALAAWIGHRERRRLSAAGAASDGQAGGIASPDQADATEQPTDVVAVSAGWPRLWWFNAGLTAVTLTSLVAAVLPLSVIFMIATAIALIVNYPNAREQRERLTAHGTAAMLMVTTILAAGVFTGILRDSGMLTALAGTVVNALPGAVLRHLPIVLGFSSMPLSLAFDPDSFYFGVLPILAGAAEAAGGEAVHVGRAALLGQMTTGFPVSPLTPSTFLLVGLANVDLVDHQRRTIPYAFAVTVVMTIVAIVTGAI